MFNVEQIKNECVNWIKDWFEQNGKGCNAVVGISGGVDSSVVAELCVEALGKDKVIGIMMPNGEQNDIEYSYSLCNHLGIKNYTVNIKNVVEEFHDMIWRNTNINVFSEQTIINLPPRVRMCTLYAISQSMNGRVANTCNLSESYVGYDTKYGDSAGDFSPLADLTKTEVRLLAKELNLPDELVNKVPQDGLTNKTDEESFGFTYDVLDRYIRTGAIDDENIKMKIDDMRRKNMFKLEPMAKFEFDV